MTKKAVTLAVAAAVYLELFRFGRWLANQLPLPVTPAVSVLQLAVLVFALLPLSVVISQWFIGFVRRLEE